MGKMIRFSSTYRQKVKEACIEYHMLVDRKRHPDGHFDRAGRWYPSDDEEMSCCKEISTPSKKHPYTLNKHCRTLAHISRKYGIDEADLRSASRRRKIGSEPTIIFGSKYEWIGWTRWETSAKKADKNRRENAKKAKNDWALETEDILFS